MKPNSIAIRVDHMSKCYRIGMKEKIHNSLGSALFDFVRSPLNNYRRYRSLYRFNDLDAHSDFGSGAHSDVIWALKDISFEVNQGGVVGIIGRNGAGKSTLLKILSRITDPTRGSAQIYGRISSLLEVGTGFHHELTGRENIYLNGTILGMKKKEIDRKLDEIIDFSGVEKFLETPVKRYSSGMKVRLAFSVAAHLEPELLIIDEVLAVGDAEFQKKCLGKMRTISQGGRTVLFVSHNMGAVIQLCPQSILIDNGRIVTQGPSKEVVQHYLSNIFSPVRNMDLRDASGRSGDGRLRFVSVYLRSEDGLSTSVPVSGQPTEIVLEFVSRENLHRVQFMLTLFNQMGIAVTHCHVDTNGHRFDVPEGKGRVVCRIPKLPLPLGQYKIAVAASDDMGKLDLVSDACIFDVQASNFFPASFVPTMRYSTALVDHSWDLMPMEDEGQ